MNVITLSFRRVHANIPYVGLALLLWDFGALGHWYSSALVSLHERAVKIWHLHTCLPGDISTLA